MDVTVSHIINRFHTALDSLYNTNEVETFARLSLEHYSAIPYANYTAYKDIAVSPEAETQYTQAIARLLTHEPIQYILGQTEFYGLVFKVSPAVLIPRPETEELVDFILKENPQALRIADICTGSGCIAISLKKNLPAAEVWATDWSDTALAMAQQNNTALAAGVNIIKHDALSDDYTALPGLFDIWVSNPPYVKFSERKLMNANVLDYEPYMALFVPDDDALVFYRHIAQAALSKLKPGGCLYFEINEAHGPEVVNLLAGLGYNNSMIINDLSQRNRMVKAVKI